MFEPELALRSELLIADETIGIDLKNWKHETGISLPSRIARAATLVTAAFDGFWIKFAHSPHLLLLLLKCVQRLLEQLAKGYSLGVGDFIQPLDDL